MERYDSGAYFDIPALIRGIPLEECSEEFEYVSAKRAFHAPEGKAFRIDGCFTVDRINSKERIAFPSDSRQRFLSTEDGRRSYENCKRDLEEGRKVELRDDFFWNGRYDIDFEWYAFEEYYEEYCRQRGDIEEEIWDELGYYFPEFFIGKWLCLDIDSRGLTNLTVRGQVKAWAATEDYTLTLMARSGEKAYYNQTEYEVEWSQKYVSIGADDDVQLSFVDIQEDDTIYIAPERIDHAITPFDYDVPFTQDDMPYQEFDIIGEKVDDALIETDKETLTPDNAIFRKIIIPEQTGFIFPPSKKKLPIIRSMAAFAVEQRRANDKDKYRQF